MGPIYDFIVKQQFAVAPPHVRGGLDRQLAARDRHEVVDVLDTIDRPTLIGAGRHDGLAPLANSEFLVGHMPNAHLEIFDGGHLMMFQDRRVWPTVVDFLDGTMSAG